MKATRIDELLQRLDDIAEANIPAVLAQLAAASQQLAARLLAKDNGAHQVPPHDGGRLLTTAREGPNFKG